MCTHLLLNPRMCHKKTTAGRAYSCLPLLHDESLFVVKSKSHNFLHLLLLLLCLAAQVFLFVLKCCVLEESSLHSFQIVADRLASFYPRVWAWFTWLRVAACRKESLEKSLLGRSLACHLLEDPPIQSSHPHSRPGSGLAHAISINFIGCVEAEHGIDTHHGRNADKEVECPEARSSKSASCCRFFMGDVQTIFNT